MFTNHLIGLIVALFLSGCKTEPPQELKARELVLSLNPTTSHVSTEILAGGLSEASIYLVTSKDQNESIHKYVVRFFPPKNEEIRTKMIQIQIIASEAGYGPKVYTTDLEEGVIVMDYLTPDTPQPIKTPTKLAHLLKAIHQGPVFPASMHIEDAILNHLSALEKISQSTKFIDTAAIREKLTTLLKDLIPFSRNFAESGPDFGKDFGSSNDDGSVLPKEFKGSKDDQRQGTDSAKFLEFGITHPHKTVACHRDLNPGNVIVSGGRYWAIDYDNASTDDPLLDIAITSLLHWFTPSQEQELVQTYFDHLPNQAEQNDLDAYRKIAMLFYATERLTKLPMSVWEQDPMQVPGLEDLLDQLRKGTYPLDSERNLFVLALSRIRHVLGE